MPSPAAKQPVPGKHRWLLLLVIGLVAGGCQQQTDSTGDDSNATVPERPLHVTVTDDPELAKAIAREWKSRAGTEITVENITTAQLSESKRLKTDLIIYPAAHLGDLAEQRLLLPLPKYLSDKLPQHNKGLLPIAKKTEVTWGPEQYAASFGSPQLLLYYRRDIFSELELQVPETWQDYQQLVTVLSDREKVAAWIGDQNQPWQAAAEPLGPGWASVTLLARAAAYVRHPNQYSGVFDYLSLEPLIGRAPFVRALEELQKAASPIATDQLTATPGSARQLFYQGHAAMALSWPSLAATYLAEQSASEAVSTAWALLPGSREVYNASDSVWETLPAQESAHVPLLAISGRLGSISRNSSHPQFAADSLLRLTSSKWSASISRRSPFTAMFRANHLANAIPWMDVGTETIAADQFADVLRQSNNSARVMFCLRIPGRDRYLAALDKAVLRVLRQESSASEALADASHRWEEITDQLGRQEQGRAYRQSLGLEP